eukprot:UN1426
MTSSPGTAEALMMLKEHPQKVIPALLKDVISRRAIEKKVAKLVKKGKISPNLVLASCRSSRPSKPKASAKRAVATKAVWKLTLSSPAIEDRVEGDPYDDGLMDDFGSLAKYFYHGEKIIKLCSSFQSAVKAAWPYVDEGIDSDVDEKSFQKELADTGVWSHDGDYGEDLVVEIDKSSVK